MTLPAVTVDTIATYRRYRTSSIKEVVGAIGTAMTSCTETCCLYVSSIITIDLNEVIAMR